MADVKTEKKFASLETVKKINNDVDSLKEDISNKITKFYASSQGKNHLADSDNGKIMDMMLYGKSEQKQYSGKNLLNATLGTTTRNGVTCTANGDGTYTLNGTATERTEFIIDVFNIDISKKYKLIAFTKERSYINCFVQLSQSPWTIYGASTDSQVTITDSKNIRLVIAVIKGTTLSNEIIKPMIVDASLYPDATYDDFEPYTGSIPSPNPDYPQEIKSVVNPTVKVCGKNLLNATLQSTVQNGVTCTANGDGTYTLNGTASDLTAFIVLKQTINTYTGKKLIGCPNGGGSGTYVLLIAYYDENRKWLSEQYDTGEGTIVKDSSHIDFQIIIKKGTVCNNLLFKPMVATDLTATYDDFEPYHEQTVTLPYTLNAIPVNSGGNITIDGQQYIADYVDVERGKLVRCVKKLFLKQYQWSKAINKGVLRFYASTIDAVGIDGNKVIKNAFSISSHFTFVTSTPDRIGTFITNADGTNANIGFAFSTDTTTSSDDFNNWILNNKPFVFLPVLKEELPLTSEQTQALKELATYYPVTNISVNSEQLDGYTVFNYPISMENGWNYVKQQIGDTRDYIYDMDLQSAEAYVNSEYAVALTELEV